MRRPAESPEAVPERIQARAASLILGVSTRTVRALAGRGELPGAAKVGRTWTFDERRLRGWVRMKEDEVAGTQSTTHAAMRRPPAPTDLRRSGDVGQAYEEAMQSLLHPERR